MQNNTYILKKYIGKDAYSDFSEEFITKDISTLEHIDFNLKDEKNNSLTDLNFSNHVLKLPKKSYDDLNNLLSHFSLTEYENEFLTLLAVSQDAYLFHDVDFKEELLNDFVNEKKELISLLDALEYYLFKDLNKLNSISFKYDSNRINIKNFFVIGEIYKGLLLHFGITKENFYLRKEEILSNSVNDFNFKKWKSFVKMKLIQAIFSFLKNQIQLSDNTNLKFCGVFLHICQIPSNMGNDEVEVGSIKNTLEIIDYQNLMHYKNGRLTYSI